MTTENETQGMVEGVGSIGGAAMETLENVKEASQECLEKGMAQAKKLGTGLGTHVKDKPIQALLITVGLSLGMGMLLGALVKK